jgi:hypothetical protein
MTVSEIKMRYKELRRMAPSFGVRFFGNPTRVKIYSILFLTVAGKQDGLGAAPGAALAASNSGLRGNISSAIAKGRIPRASTRRRRKNV